MSEKLYKIKPLVWEEEWLHDYHGNHYQCEVSPFGRYEVYDSNAIGSLIDNNIIPNIEFPEGFCAIKVFNNDRWVLVEDLKKAKEIVSNHYSEIVEQYLIPA